LDGAIAQLGERLLCKQEVVGSIPSGSTRSRDASKLEETWFRCHRGSGMLDIVKKGYAQNAGYLSASSLGIGCALRWHDHERAPDVG
jgi:hypothetical protein